MRKKKIGIFFWRKLKNNCMNDDIEKYYFSDSDDKVDFLSIKNEQKEEWEDAFTPTTDKEWNEFDDSKENNFGFKYFSKMNDTEQNRKGMEALLNLGPADGVVFKNYKLPWESKKNSKKLSLKNVLKEALIKLKKGKIIVSQSGKDFNFTGNTYEYLNLFQEFKKLNPNLVEFSKLKKCWVIKDGEIKNQLMKRLSKITKAKWHNNTLNFVYDIGGKRFDFKTNSNYWQSHVKCPKCNDEFYVDDKSLKNVNYTSLPSYRGRYGEADALEFVCSNCHKKVTSFIYQ